MPRAKTPEHEALERQAEEVLPLSETIQFTLAILYRRREFPYRVLKEIKLASKGTVCPQVGNYYVALKRAEICGLITYPEGTTDAINRRKGTPIEITTLGRVALDLQIERTSRILTFMRKQREAAFSLRP